MGRTWWRRAAALAAAAMAMLPAAAVNASAADGDGGTWTPYTRAAQYAAVTDKDVAITMRDGTVLKANVARPDAPGRFPVLVTQTPYGKDAAGAALGGSSDPLVERGYVQVTVDVRGTGHSAGSWDSFGPNEQRDGYDIVEWAARQAWSDGNVGLDGPSYMGLTQLYTAALRPPHLKAIFPVVPMADGYRDIVFSGGDINVSFIPLWLGLVTGGGLVTDPVTLLQHVGGALSFTVPTLLGSITGSESVAFDGPFWKTRSPIEVLDRIQVPAFVVGGLHDIFQRGEPLIYERLKNRVPSRLLIGPWTHVSGSQGAGLPADGVPSLTDLQLRWFDHWLKGIDTNVDGIPKVTQYTYGDERWETQADWPNPRLDPQTWYLRGGQTLTREAPGTSEPAQSFVQQPVGGLCTMSTGQWTAGLAEALPCFTDDRPNALSGGATYLTAPLASDLRVSGPLAARLWVTTTASDAAVTVRVDDVAPDGTSTGMTTGWQTASFRATDSARTRVVKGHVLQPWHPFTRASVLPVKAGEPTALDVEVFPTNWVLKAGHRLKVVVDPADFPHQLPPLPSLLARLGGQVRVLTEPGHASSIELPTIGARCVRAGCASLPVPDLTRAD